MMRIELYDILVEHRDEISKNQWLAGFRANFINHGNKRRSVPWRPVIEWLGNANATAVMACQFLEEMGVDFTLAWDERNVPSGQEMGWVVVRDYFPQEQPNVIHDFSPYALSR